jgi:hypothetical protein
VLVGNCKEFAKQTAKYREIIPLSQIIYDLHIDKNELISFKIAVNEAAETYGIDPLLQLSALSILYQTIIRKVNCNMSCVS